MASWQERGFSPDFPGYTGSTAMPMEKRFLPSEDMYASAKTQKAAQARFSLKPHGTVSVAKERNEVRGSLSYRLSTLDLDVLLSYLSISSASSSSSF